MIEDGMISALAAGLGPVKPLAHPALRMSGWLSLVAVIGAGLALVADMGQVRDRLMEVPDLRWALAGALLTSACAAFAAFELSVPGRSAWWIALPTPPAMLWLGASGFGCLRSWGLPGIAPANMHDAMGCVRFITLVSVPLSLLLLWMLRRACPLWPARTATMAGLAAAAAAASLLTLFHEHDASAVDLAMHIVAVAAVVVTSRVAGVAVI
jgi:hypothetical protein